MQEKLTVFAGGLLILGALALTVPGRATPDASSPQPDGYVVEAVVAEAAAGAIAGTVQFSGPAPERPVLQMAADPFCVSAHAGQTVRSEVVVVNDNGTLKSVFVHIRAEGASTLSAGAGATAVLNQQACMYSPRVVGMQAGSTLRVVNSDQTLHNVNVQARNNPSFNAAQPIPGMATERVFENPEVMIPVRCDVHPWMQAFVGVVAHPYFAVTGDDGGFRIDGVPSGVYVIEAWHESLGTQSFEVTVSDGQTASAEFSFEAAR